MSRYGSYDVAGSGFRYIHCDLTDVSGYFTITLTVGSTFATNLSPRLNVESYICIANVGVMF